MAKSRRRKAASGPPPQPNDRATLELLGVGVSKARQRHDAFTIEETMQAGLRRARVKTECIIDRYHERMQINDPQKDAGLKFRALWMRATHAPAVTASYGERHGNGGGAITGIDARAELRDAIEGAGLSSRERSDVRPLLLTESGVMVWMERMPSSVSPAGQVVIAVCGMDEWAGGSQRLMMLREALTDLARYWKIRG